MVDSPPMKTLRPAHALIVVLAVIAEERGFIGASFLIVVYVVLLLMGVETAWNAKDKLGALDSRFH